MGYTPDDVTRLRTAAERKSKVTVELQPTPTNMMDIEWPSAIRWLDLESEETRYMNNTMGQQDAIQ